MEFQHGITADCNNNAYAHIISDYTQQMFQSDSI